ncbi:MAG: tRNA uridine-5-carboxymethylaminomethyl(34) synthesis GTPase MnmE [Candidatus Marinimicrobia bacterium]|nr:tRNA uridine-5-carboxymethylaminomethyl(34) synthesis GTPase MnmE [Candidatus Neomarinimicrobiota bacterium]
MTTAVYNDDTVAAISTPPGVGGISVVRISGNDALRIALNGLAIKTLKPRYAQFTHVVDLDTDEILDDVVVTYFKAPASYTGEDTVEISCHGGFSAAPAILALYYRLGARPALPGEFTRRAFVNGKLDLLQAEAVADLIHAVSDTGQKLATRTLSGKLSEKVHALRNELTDIASILELELDFSEEEITPLPHEEINKKIDEAKTHIFALVDSYSAGKILREGVLVPIVGRPNTGKSSLLNALLEEDRAIISHIPGTTRDTIEESFAHQGFLFRLVDTAGLRKTQDPIEKIGTERAYKTLGDADMILLVVDITMTDGYAFEKQFLSRYSKIPVIVVYNKIDLSFDLPVLDAEISIAVSATHHQHLDVLLEKMLSTIQLHYRVDGSTIAITKQRHKHALLQVIEALNCARQAIFQSLSNEYIALDIREAINALDDITGHTTSEDVLNNIFDHFCIGK